MMGLLLIDKPVGITSQQCISKVKKKLNLDKIGHSGTLDPMASGLLVCLAGRSTKLARFAEQTEKIYTGSILLGRKTTTDDIEGETIEENEVEVTEDQIQKIIQDHFTGTIEQIPPQYSALKVNGVRAYKNARVGEHTELKARQVQIKSFQAELNPELIQRQIEFEIRCSVGTYIRSIARDMGDYLGCGACLSKLRRTQSGIFDVDNAKSIEDVTAEDILDWSNLFTDITKIEINSEILKRFQNGCQFALKDFIEAHNNQIGDNNLVIYQNNSIPSGLLQKDQGKWTYAFIA